jgi:hypothetical protein
MIKITRHASGLGSILSSRLSDPVRWIIASYLLPTRSEGEEQPPTVCDLCGDFGVGCQCWLSRPNTHQHPLSEIYDLGLWCIRCHNEHPNCQSYCQCWRVRSRTRCRDCQARMAFAERAGGMFCDQVETSRLCSDCVTRERLLNSD